MRITRRQALLGATAALLPVPAMAAPEYRLDPRQIADGVWLIEGAQDSIARQWLCPTMLDNSASPIIRCAGFMQSGCCKS